MAEEAARLGGSGQARSAAPTDHHVSIPEAAGRAALAGPTMGFDDEIGGAVAAFPSRDPGDRVLPRRAVPPSASQEQKMETYQVERDRLRAAKDAAAEQHPYVYYPVEIGTGVASAMLAPASGVARGASALKAAAAGAKAGAGYGAAAGLGGSRADLTKGEVGGALFDTAVGGAAGAVLGGAAGGVTQGVGNKLAERAATHASAAAAATERASAVSSATEGRAAGIGDMVAGVEKAAAGVAAGARRAATDVADKAGLPSLIGRGETIRSASEKARALQAEWSGMLGEKVRLKPSQVTGDPSLALAESKAAQFPRTMLKAQAEEAKRLEQSAKILDMYVDGIAKDPARLGRADVSNELVGAVDRHVESLVTSRSKIASPLYEAAERAGSFVNARPIGDAIRGMIDQNKFNPSSVTSQLKTLLGKVEEAAGKEGALSIADTQNLRSLLTKAVRGKETIIDNMPVENQTRIAREVLTAVDVALDETANTTGGDGARLLKMANSAWRAGSNEIDAATTDTVARILKVGATDASDTLSRRLSSASPEQVRGVFRMLNKSAPDTAQQFRAQLLEEAMAGAKPSREARLAAEKGIAKLQPQSALTQLQKAEPMLRAAFDGDSKAQIALSRTYDLLQRLNFGPGIKGSQTAPLLGQAAQEAGDMVAAAAGPHVQLAWKGIKSFLKSEKTVEALTTAQGIDDFNRFLSAAMDISGGRSISAEAARAIYAAATRYGLDMYEQARALDQPAGVRRGGI